MKTGRELGVVLRVAIIAGALGIAGAAATGVVVLPSQANEHATTSTSEVTTGQPTAAPTEAGTPAPQAAFGQCVVENAGTASENGGEGWNPTEGCTNTSAAAAHSANENANDAAADGLATAAVAGGNGAAHANANGSDNAGAGADNAGSHQ